MQSYFAKTTLYLASLICVFAISTPMNVAHAVENPEGQTAKAAFLKDFVKRMKSGYRRSETFLQDAGIAKAPLDLRGLPEGEPLIFEVVLPDNLFIDGTILSQVGKNTILVSLRDFITVVNFPIEYDQETGSFDGWFIRENNRFSYDPQTDLIKVNDQEFRLSSVGIKQEDDILVSIGDIGVWFDTEITADVGTQQLKLDPARPFPIMEALKRQDFKAADFSRKPASLPRGDDDYKLISAPLIDVNTQTTLRDRTGSDREIDRNLNIRTANEFAYGTLTTNISANDEDNITNARVSYLQESADPELLGPLKARRFEIGDIQPTRIPITGSAGPEQGIRITNTDPFVNQTFPSTQISGYIFPGWDVELYRERSLLDFQSTDEDGFYIFDNVPLFSDRNFFRVVAYGPQGEIREEAVNVPFDQNREAINSSVYDVSFTRQNRQFYEANESQDEDRDTAHFVGFFETPLTGNTALRLGARYRQEEGENRAYASAGVSTSYVGALVNADFAADNEGELAAELAVTRQFGPHNFRADLDLATDNYDPGGTSNTVQTFSNRYSLEGPVPFALGKAPRYGSSISYNQDSDNETALSGLLNLNTQFGRLGFNQSLNYLDSSTNDDGAQLGSITSLSGAVGKNIFRGLANYNITPESELESLTASWRRRISGELESQFEVNRTIESGINRYSAQVNWRPEYATITPRISRDSDGNTEATLNTRFGLSRAEETGEFIFSREFITNSGTITAFVYLDKDGNQMFDGEDEPIPNVTIRTPQNSSGAKTNEKGIALVSRLRPNLVTDVFVEPASLEDPFWIPATEGVSIMPRTGTNVKLDIPIHIAGEIDGTVFVKKADGGSASLRNASLTLYDENGEVEQTTRAGSDGFYIFSLVPPGTYSLLVDEDAVPADVSRPKPQTIQIGFEGTTIFANDVILKAGQDVPSEILADLKDYKDLHPHIDFANTNYDIALNLGDYSSRLMTSLVWYHLKTRYGAIFNGGQLFVPPSQSFANARTGQHTLRVGLKTGANIDDAYNRCRALLAREIYCKVEIFPALQQKFAQKQAETQKQRQAMVDALLDAN